MLPPFGWQAVFTQWHFVPVVTASVAVAAVLYIWGVMRVARRHPVRPWSVKYKSPLAAKCRSFRPLKR